MSAQPTVALAIRETPQRLEAIKDRARRCGMSVTDFYRHGAFLAMQFTDAGFIRVAAEQMARERKTQSTRVGE